MDKALIEQVYSISSLPISNRYSAQELAAMGKFKMGQMWGYGRRVVWLRYSTIQNRRKVENCAEIGWRRLRERVQSAKYEGFRPNRRLFKTGKSLSGIETTGCAQGRESEFWWDQLSQTRGDYSNPIVSTVLQSTVDTVGVRYRYSILPYPQCRPRYWRSCMQVESELTSLNSFDRPNEPITAILSSLYSERISNDWR